MKITNNQGLPEPIIKLAENPSYSKGGADFSATEIISPVRIARLRAKHGNSMSQDVSDMMWSMVGTALHQVLETECEGYISEERVFAEVHGSKLSGQIDLQQPTPAGINIYDYKLTSAFNVRKASQEEWEQQLNVYAFLLREAKRAHVRSLNVVAFIRDWSRRMAASNSQYPQAPIVVIEQPLWPAAQARAFVNERVKAHQDARLDAEWDKPLPECTSRERWETATYYAVMKPKRKTAYKICSSLEEATDIAKEICGTVDVRAGEPVRCKNNFCGVAKWCSQYQKEVIGERISETE